MYTLSGEPPGQVIGDAIVSEINKVLLVGLSLAVIGIYVIYKVATK
jgi:hypothetical protein